MSSTIKTISSKAYVQVLGLACLAMSTPAWAKLSDYGKNVADETTAFGSIFVTIAFWAGVIAACVAAISAVITKMRNEPMKWQVPVFIIGVLAILIPTLLSETTESITNERIDVDKHVQNGNF